MEETVFLDSKENQVLVTSSRLVANNKTYAMSNISSVGMNQVSPSYTLPIILIVIGVIVVFNSLIPGILLAAGGTVWCLMLKPQYAVRINSNSGEANVYTSKEEAEAQEILNAMNKAIIHRG